MTTSAGEPVFTELQSLGAHLTFGAVIGLPALVLLCCLVLRIVGVPKAQVANFALRAFEKLFRLSRISQEAEDVQDRSVAQPIIGAAGRQKG